jgi:translation initiation factor 2B subunit (eIF-2B alpha/beta/delta family)
MSVAVIARLLFFFRQGAGTGAAARKLVRWLASVYVRTPANTENNFAHIPRRKIGNLLPPRGNHFSLAVTFLFVVVLANAHQRTQKTKIKHWESAGTHAAREWEKPWLMKP